MLLEEVIKVLKSLYIPIQVVGSKKFYEYTLIKGQNVVYTLREIDNRDNVITLNLRKEEGTPVNEVIKLENVKKCLGESVSLYSSVIFNNPLPSHIIRQANYEVREVQVDSLNNGDYIILLVAELCSLLINGAGALSFVGVSEQGSTEVLIPSNIKRGIDYKKYDIRWRRGNLSLEIKVKVSNKEDIVPHINRALDKASQGLFDSFL